VTDGAATQAPVVDLAGKSMLAIVRAIPELEARTGRKAVVIGGLAVLCRLGIAYRATGDLDTASRRAAGDRPQLDVLSSASFRKTKPTGLPYSLMPGLSKPPRR
jgi:hypothetical protein